MIALYLDENVAGPVVAGLRRRGVDVLTVQEDGHGGLPDEQVMARSCELDRPVVTHDADFLRISRDYLRDRLPFPGVIYTHQDRLATSALIEDLETVAAVSSPEDLRDKVTFLPL